MTQLMLMTSISLTPSISYAEVPEDKLPSTLRRSRRAVTSPPLGELPQPSPCAALGGARLAGPSVCLSVRPSILCRRQDRAPRADAPWKSRSRAQCFQCTELHVAAVQILHFYEE
ncbi:hypothetical protein Q5P01_021761 [Channa striata]|uniref:Uncharacterized protein n=1 Tax=Channa striata TaxID=64152 RepID=A0AA88RZE5_CHASR|nr:hypothetical protein Q5P01_021761 [Channa striata]